MPANRRRSERRYPLRRIPSLEGLEGFDRRVAEWASLPRSGRDDRHDAGADDLGNEQTLLLSILSANVISFA
jgi:hypothetical protein